MDALIDTVPPGQALRPVRRTRDGSTRLVQDCIAEEVPVALICNGQPFAVMMATPSDLEDFAVGFALSEGLVGHAGDAAVTAIEPQLEGVSVQLRIPEPSMALVEQRRRSLSGRSGCGICGSEMLEAAMRFPDPVSANVSISEATLRRALRELRGQQPLASATGATHAAGWADVEGHVRIVREDVGRHNALDKLIGALARAGIDPAQGFAVVTSRASYEMAMKAASVGIGLLAAISAPTALAISLADRANLTLVGFARDDGHAVYSHAHRLHTEPSP